MNDGYKLLDLTLILYLFLPTRKNTGWGGFQTVNYSHMYSGVPCLTMIPHYGFMFNSDTHEVMVLELRRTCLLLGVNY